MFLISSPSPNIAYPSRLHFPVRTSSTNFIPSSPAVQALQLDTLRYARRSLASYGKHLFIAQRFSTKLRHVFVSHCEYTVHYTLNGSADWDMQSSDDIIYEQDILRDPASSKPWLIYIDYKHQHGTLLEQAFVCWSVSQANGLKTHRSPRYSRELVDSCRVPTNFGRWCVAITTK